MLNNTFTQKRNFFHDESHIFIHTPKFLIRNFLNFLDVIEFRDNNRTFGGFLFDLIIINLSVGGLIEKQILLCIDGSYAVFDNVVHDHLKLLVIFLIILCVKPQSSQYFFNCFFLPIMIVWIILLVQLERRLWFLFFRSLVAALINIVCISLIYSVLIRLHKGYSLLFHKNTFLRYSWIPFPQRILHYVLDLNHMFLHFVFVHDLDCKL